MLLTGIPARVRTHDVTKQVEYIGDVQNLVEKLSDLPAGGQVLMGPLTYQRIYSRLEEFRIHSLQKSYEQPARCAICYMAGWIAFLHLCASVILV